MLNLRTARRFVMLIGIIALMCGSQIAGVMAQAPTPAGVVSSSGALTGREIIVSQLDNEQHLPSVAYNWKHHEYLVVWHNTWGGGFRDIYAQRVSERGELLSGFTVVHDANSNAQPSVAYDPVHDRYLVVWIYDSSGSEDDWDVWGRFIPWQGPDAGMTEFSICTWNTNQWNPKVAYGRAVEEFMVVWTNEYASGVLPMYVSAARINAANGNVVNTLTIDSDPTEHRFRPDIAYNLARNEYLVVWETQGGSNDDIWGLRLTGTGGALGGGKFGIAGWPSSEEQPAVAACAASDTYYVAWQSHIGPNNYDVYGRFVAGDGAPGAVHHFDYTSVDESFPDVDCNPGTKEFLVVFQQQYSSASGPFGIFGQTVAPTGLGDPFTIRGIYAGDGTTWSEPAVAGGGTHYLTVWEHPRPATAFQDIHGRLSTMRPVFLPGLER